MRILIFVLGTFLIGLNCSAADSVSCSENKLSANALTDKMTQLKNKLEGQNLSSDARKKMVKKTLDEMNCQIDLTAKDPNIDSPSRWKSIQYQDLLTVALKTDCTSSQQSFAIRSEGAGHDDTPDSITKNDQAFLNAYCEKKGTK